MSAACGSVHPDFPELSCTRARHDKTFPHGTEGISWTEAPEGEYRPDQQAVDWARGCVQASAQKFRGFEAHAQQAGNPESARMWRWLAAGMEKELIGGGCIIGPFHEKVVKLQEELDALRAHG